MNEGAGAPAPASGPTAGRLLREAREKQGLHIAALAAAIKVSPKKLEMLESDRFDALPDATFTRALAQTVCRTLKIDARPVLDKLPPASAMALEPRETSINEPFRERPGRDEPSFAATAVRPMIWGAALLLVAAAVVYLLPADLWSRFSAPAVLTEPIAKPLVVAPLPAAAPLAPDVVSVASAVVSGAVPASASASAAASAASSSLVTAGERGLLASPPAAAAALPVAAAASALVQLRTTQASWIEVRDARGATLLSRTVLPGENVGLDGNLPIRMTIGNASATQLGFRGQVIDLAPRTRDNIARVELQ